MWGNKFKTHVKLHEKVGRRSRSVFLMLCSHRTCDAPKVFILDCVDPILVHVRTMGGGLV